jgi:hypothetical protein
MRSSACVRKVAHARSSGALEENWNARRYYEQRDWTLTDETRVVPFPPNPIDVQYEKEL